MSTSTLFETRAKVRAKQTESSELIFGQSTQNVNQNNPDLREKEDVQKVIKDFIKEHKMKQGKCPGGRTPNFYVSKMWTMSIRTGEDGSTTIDLQPSEKNKNGIRTVYKYDLAGHLTQKSAFWGGTALEKRTRYYPNGTVAEYTFSDGQLIDSYMLEK